MFSLPRSQLVTACRTAGACVVLSGFLAACGIDKGDPSFIGERSAVVQCTVARLDRPDPPLFDTVPRVPLPTGLFTQEMSPVALVKIGYQRDSVVCVTLEAPTEAELAASAASIETLLDTRTQVDDRAHREVACACPAAGRLRRQRWLPSCAKPAAKRNCEPDATAVANMERILGDLDAALGAAMVSRTHWRVFGRTDRVGQFGARVSDILGHHTGGSSVHLAGQPISERLNHVLLRALFDVPHVQAVIRQDSGRALVVVRELDDILVYDHFAYPDVSSAMMTLLPELDNRSVAQYLAALQRPATPRELPFDPTKGPLVLFDHDGLDYVDAATIVGTALSSRRYKDDGQDEIPPRWFDTVAVQAPFAASELQARLELSAAGIAWASELPSGPVSPTLSEFGTSATQPVFARSKHDPQFVLRGTPVEQVVFSGFHALPGAAAAIEMEWPSSIEGKMDDFEVAIPRGRLPGAEEPREGVKALREQLSQQSHRLRVQVSASDSVVEMSLVQEE